MKIQRRKFIAGLGLASLAMGTSGIQEKKPNILFLFADDQMYDTIRAHGNDEIYTPNLDRLVQRGMSFSNCYNPGSFSGAVCIASRTMLNTGMNIWQAKQYFNDFKKNKLKSDDKLWSVCMQNAGYDTYGAGKWHVKPSFDAAFKYKGTERPGMPNQTPEGYGRPDPSNPWTPWDPKYEGFWKGGKHWSEVLADESVGFIEQASQSENPFFMYLAFNAPHDPRQAPKKFIDMYPAEKLRVPESFMPEYPEANNIGIGDQCRDAQVAPFPRSQEAALLHKQEYYALITHMDEQIGKILDALDASGKADNTYIFFTADHGLAVGEHGMMGKQNMYDHSMCPPFIVSGPGVKPGSENTTPIYLQDIMPTTLELGGATAQRPVDFKSIAPLMRGKSGDHYDVITGAFSSISKDKKIQFEQRMIADDDYTLILYPILGTVKLFNTDKDPHQMENLALNAENKGRVKSLIKKLHKKHQANGDPLDLTEYYAEWM